MKFVKILPLKNNLLAIYMQRKVHESIRHNGRIMISTSTILNIYHVLSIMGDFLKRMAQRGLTPAAYW